MGAKRLPLVELDGAEETEEGFRTPRGFLVSRVDVWGVVARKIEGEKSTFLLLDDFTATFPVVSFVSVDVDEGDVVRVLGRLNRRNGDLRIVADVVRKISPKEELLHRLDNLVTVLSSEGEEEVEVVELL